MISVDHPRVVTKYRAAHLTSFVDEPRHAVEEADGLVAEVIRRLAQTVAEERTKLEQQWGKGNDTSQESTLNRIEPLRQGMLVRLAQSGCL